MGIGQSKQEVYTEINGNTVVVRNGTEWIGVFHRDGRLIASAQRFPWANPATTANAVEQPDAADP